MVVVNSKVGEKLRKKYRVEKEEVDFAKFINHSNLILDRDIQKLTGKSIKKSELMKIKYASRNVTKSMQWRNDSQYRILTLITVSIQIFIPTYPRTKYRIL